MDAAKETVINLLENNRQTKVKLILTCIMERTEIKTGEVIVKDAAFHSEQEVYLESTDIDEMYMKMKDRVIENLTVFQRGQSGWRFRSIVSLNIFTAEYKPLKGSSYIPFLAVWLVKKAIINMQNEDDQCFKCSVTRALNSKEIPTVKALRQLAK